MATRAQARAGLGAGQAASGGPAAINIDAFLRAEGFDTEEALHEGRVVLERHKLTRPGKQGFIAEKLAPARTALARDLLRTCAGCRPLAPARPLRVAVSALHCQLCRGSNNRRAASRAIQALKKRKMRRIVVVGGSPGQQRDLRDLVAGSAVELRFIDGTQSSHSQKDAELNKRWAELIVVWGPTPLRHSVSNSYTDEVYAGLKVVTVPRRGIEALCDEVVRAVR